MNCGGERGCDGICRQGSGRRVFRVNNAKPSDVAKSEQSALRVMGGDQTESLSVPSDKTFPPPPRGICISNAE